MSDPTPEARLAAALATSAWVIQAARLWAQPTTAEQLAAQIAAHLAADPTLAADLALAAAVRGLFSRCSYHQGWDDECGQPEADPIHPSTNERMGNDQHVFRNDWVDMKVAAAIKAAKEAECE